MDRQVGRYQKGERQVIGDRVVLNPRTRLCSLRDAEGNVFDTSDCWRRRHGNTDSTATA